MDRELQAPLSIRDADRATKRSLRSGILAFYVDQFDIYLPVLVLAPIGAYFEPMGLDPTTASVLSAMVFAATLIARPIGAAIFGNFADTAGRKRSTIVAMTGFGVITLLIALIPGSATIGGWSIGLLIGLRFLNGIFLGGAYTSAVPLALEWTPPHRRGLVAGRILSASPAAYATLGLLSFLLQQLMSSDGVDSDYARWGWRIPFLIGALLAFVAVIGYRRSAVESSTRRTTAGERRPLAELLVGRFRRDLLQVLILMSGVWLASNMVSAVMPQLLRSQLALSGTEVAAVSTINSIGLVVAFQVYGALSQRTGRRPFYLWYGAVMAVIGSSLYALLMTSGAGPVQATILACAVGWAVQGSFGPIAAYLTERFPAQVRASGFGTGYSLALVLPAFYSFYLAGLGQVMPSYLAPVVLIVIAGALVSIGGALGPETRDADLRR